MVESLVVLILFIFVLFFAPNVQALIVQEVFSGMPWGYISDPHNCLCIRVLPHHPLRLGNFLLRYFVYFCVQAGFPAVRSFDFCLIESALGISGTIGSWFPMAKLVDEP